MLLVFLLTASIGIAATLIQTRIVTDWKPWLVGLAILLLLSLLASLIHRTRKEINRIRNGPNRFRHYGQRRQISLQQGAEAWYPKLRRILRNSDWKVPNSPDKQQFIVERGTAGLWGSLIFHTGLAVIIIGILISLLFGYRGMFALTEGETFVEGQVPFRNVSSGIDACRAAKASLEITLEDFNPRFQIAGTPTEASQLSIHVSGNRYRDLVYFNHGLRLDKGILHQQRWGYSPGLIIRDAQGIMVFNGYIRLASQNKRGKSLHRDQVQLTDGNQLTLELREDPVASTISPVEQVNERPVLELSLHAGSDELFHGKLRVGETASMGGYLVAFPQFRHWAQFELVRDPSLPVLISGVILVILGLLTRIMFVRQRLAVSFRETNTGILITISGWSEKYPASFEENINALIYQIETDLQADGRIIAESEVLKTLSGPSHATC